MKTLLIGTLALIGIAATPVDAMPLDSRTVIDNGIVENIHVVCDEYGRCWRTGPRRGYRQDYRPRGYYSDGYRYGGYDWPRNHDGYYRNRQRCPWSYTVQDGVCKPYRGY